MYTLWYMYVCHNRKKKYADEAYKKGRAYSTRANDEAVVPLDLNKEKTQTNGVI